MAYRGFASGLTSAIALFGAAITSGCATGPIPDPTTHAVLTNPKLVSTTPLLLIGVEKYDDSGTGRVAYNPPDGVTIREGRDAPCGSDKSRCIDLAALDKHEFNDRQRTWLRKNLLARLDDGSQMVVTHIVAFPGQTGQKSCVYSAYAPGADGPCSTTASTPYGVQVGPSWTTLEKDFAGELSKQLGSGDITHVIVMATGWKFTQARSLESFDQWMTGINAGLANHPDIRPLYVGLTWPAVRGGWFDKNLFYFNKAHDSDEVGLIWANAVVNQVVGEQRKAKEVKVVLVGHSFGARMFSRAAFSGSALRAPCNQAPDLVIGLQAAFATSRFRDNTAQEPAVFSAYNTCGTRSVYTTSRGDKAVIMAPSQLFSLKSAYMGTHKAYRLTESDPLFARAIWRGKEDIDLPPLNSGENGDNRRRILMIDGTYLADGKSKLISDHNDVFDGDSGALIAKLIQTYAPPNTVAASTR